MGKFKELVDTEEGMRNFRSKYNLQHLKGQGYYLKSRQSEVRLIQCLPISNKGLKEDFLIFSGQWHDGLPCPVKEGELSGRLTVISNI